MEQDQQLSLLNRASVRIAALAMVAGAALTSCGISLGGSEGNNASNASPTTAESIAPDTTLPPATTVPEAGVAPTTTIKKAPATTTTTKPPATTTTTTRPPTAAECISKMPDSQLAGEVLMVGIQTKDMPTQASIFKADHIGGVFIVGNTTTQSDANIIPFKKSTGGLYVAADVEGGDINRFSTVGTLPTEQAVAAARIPTATIEKKITAFGVKLKALGDDVILGPLADAAKTNGTSVLGDRIFSSDPNIVTTYDAAYIKGWEAAGLVPVIKHFPGLGSATGNTDNGPATIPPLSQLLTRDLVPYQHLSTSGADVMVNNATVPGWTTGPASLSPTVDQYLRKVLGYNNTLVMTDSLTAKAIQVPIDTAVVEALEAGYDVALVNEPSESVTADAAFLNGITTAIEKALGKQINRQQLQNSVAKVFAVQGVNPCTLVPAPKPPVTTTTTVKAPAETTTTQITLAKPSS